MHYASHPVQHVFVYMPIFDLDAQASGSGRPVQFAVVLWGEPSDKCRSLLDCQVLSFADVLSKVG